MLIDVHCHANLYLVIDQIVKEADQAGVNKIIAVSMSKNSLKRVLEISKLGSIYPALGIHPEEVRMNKKIESELDYVVEIIRKNHNNLCAIGEIGLDHYFIKEKELYPLQKKIFDILLLIAEELELPVNLHTKGAEQLVFDTLPSYNNIPNVNIHWYSGPENFLKIGIDRGYYFSITPAVSYSPAVKKTVLMVDKEHLLLENDGPVKYSGKVGTPAMVKDVLKIVSKFKEIPEPELE